MSPGNHDTMPFYDTDVSTPINSIISSYGYFATAMKAVYSPYALIPFGLLLLNWAWYRNGSGGRQAGADEGQAAEGQAAQGPVAEGQVRETQGQSRNLTHLDHTDAPPRAARRLHDTFRPTRQYLFPNALGPIHAKGSQR